MLLRAIRLVLAAPIAGMLLSQRDVALLGKNPSKFLCEHGNPLFTAWCLGTLLHMQGAPQVLPL
jgi:hypothetical protein